MMHIIPICLTKTKRLSICYDARITLTILDSHTINMLCLLATPVRNQTIKAGVTMKKGIAVADFLVEILNLG